MYPNTPQPNPTPVDYLNQIAPQTSKKKIFTFGPRSFILIGIALVVLVIAVSIIVNVIINTQRHPLEQLSARLNATATVVNGAQTKLKSTQLRSLNSNLKIYLTNTNRDIADPLLSAGVNVTKLSASVTKDESSDALTARLEDARLNAVYDRTYAREMAYQLATIVTLMKQIDSSTSNQKLKNFLDSAYTNLVPTQKAFEDFNAANS